MGIINVAEAFAGLKLVLFDLFSEVAVRVSSPKGIASAENGDLDKEKLKLVLVYTVGMVTFNV